MAELVEVELGLEEHRPHIHRPEELRPMSRMQDSEQKSVAEEERRILTGLIEQRFGSVPEGVRSRLAAASEAELVAWSERLLEADSLDEVFG